MKNTLKKFIALLITMAMLLGIFGSISIFAETTGLSVYGIATFDNATVAEGTYQGMSLAYTVQKGDKIGVLSLDNNSVPYFGTMLKFAQTASSLSSNGMQYMDFILADGLEIGENAPENSYAEFSADVKLLNRETGINFDLANKNHTGNTFMFRSTIRANGDIYLNNTMNIATAPSGTNAVFNNMRIRVDLHNKTIVQVYVDDELMGDFSQSPIEMNNANVDTIDRLKICIGKQTETDTLYIDNVNVVTYVSTDETSPLASKMALRGVIDEIDAESLTSSQKTVFDNAVAMVKNPIATQSDVDAMVEELKAFSDVPDIPDIPDTPDIPDKAPFTIIENFEDDLENSVFDVTYGQGIISQEIYDDVPYGNNTLKIKTDTTQKNVSQYVDFGLGNKKIKCESEDANCYVEFGIDFASYNLSKYGKNMFVYFRDSSKVLAYLYITGGNTIRIAGGPDGEIILGKIDDPAKMKNVRIVMQITDNEGNLSQKITAVYADNELLEYNYPIAMVQSSELNMVRVMISNIKDSDFGLDKEWAINVDNMIIRKYYSENGENELYTTAELVSLMRSFDAEIMANFENGTYTEEQLNEAKSVISLAAQVYMNQESTEEDINNAYNELYAARKRVTMPSDKNFDFVHILTSSDKIPGNTEILMNMNVVSSSKITDSVSPTFVALLMKKGENEDEILRTDIKTIKINPNSNGEITLSFDVSAYSEDEKEDMYIKLIAFDSISEMKLANVETIMLFNSENEVNNDKYRYSSDKCAYQIVDGDVLSVFTSKREPDKECVLLVVKSGFDFTDFSDETLKENLVYVNSSSYDKNGRNAFIVKGIPSGEYTYSINGDKGKFISSSKSAIENAITEVCQNPEKLENVRYILGIDEVAYDKVKANGIQPSDVLADMLEKKSYTLSEIQKFGSDLISNISMVNDFKSVKTADYVREAISQYSGNINNISQYNSLNGHKKSIADAYILGNKNKITSIKKLEEVIEDAVKEAKNQNTSSGGGSSSGGGGGGGSSSGGGGKNGSYPSGSTVIASTESQEKEYGDITEVYTEEFKDIDNYEWAKPAIALLVKKGSVNGKANGVFAPADNVTREEFVKMLLLTFDFEIKEISSSFIDVDNSSWYAPYVMSAINSGIVKGVSDNKFGVGQFITREDATVLLARVLVNMNASYSENGEYIPFIDEETISDYAYDSVVGMAKSGVVNGVSGNYFAPKQTATRAEAAKLIYEAYMFMVSEGV